MKDPNMRAQTPSKYLFSVVDGRGVNILIWVLLLNGEPCQVRLDLNYTLSICSEEYQPKLRHKSILQALFPDHNQGKDVYYQGSRQMTSTSRRYYEMELGAGMAPSPGMNEMFGYSEPLRRFIQREGFEPQANEIPNTMPSWMPGDDYYTNFRVGDPYIKVDQGFARLPGKGYEALHPELEGTNPEDYPDINKMAILADVAPYSREYNTRSRRPARQQNPRVRAGVAAGFSALGSSPGRVAPPGAILAEGIRFHC